jgi:hypothetical protein
VTAGIANSSLARRDRRGRRSAVAARTAPVRVEVVGTGSLGSQVACAVESTPGPRLAVAADAAAADHVPLEPLHGATVETDSLLYALRQVQASGALPDATAVGSA